MTTTDHETTRALRSWLEEGPSPTDLPDPIFDAVMERVPTIRQRRARWPGIVWPSANLMARFSVAAAVVVLAAWAAINAPGIINVAVPEPSAESSEDAEAAVRSTLRFWIGRQPPAGTYYVDEPFPMRIALTLPDEIEPYSLTSGFAGVCTPTCEPQVAGIDLWLVENVYADPCRIEAGIREPPLGDTVDDFVDYILSIERATPSDVTDVTVSGYSGKYVELAADADLSDCSSESLRLFYNNPGSIFFRSAFAGSTDRLWVLDVEGTRLVIDLFAAADAPAEDIDALERVIASIRIEHVGETPPRTN